MTKNHTFLCRKCVTRNCPKNAVVFDITRQPFKCFLGTANLNLPGKSPAIVFGCKKMCQKRSMFFFLSKAEISKTFLIKTDLCFHTLNPKILASISVMKTQSTALSLKRERNQGKLFSFVCSVGILLVQNLQVC